MMATGEIVQVVALTLLAIICVLTNSLVCFVIQTRKTIDSLAKYYILSPPAADFLVGAICMPFTIWFIAYGLKHANSGTYLVVFHIFELALNGASIIHLSVMSVDRAVAVARPIHHRQNTTKRKIFTILGIIWASSLSFAFIVIFMYKAYYKIMAILVISVFFLVPLVIITTSYICIFYKIRERNRATTVGRINEWKLASTILCVIIVFVVCWTPFHAVTIYATVLKFRNKKGPNVLWVLTLVKWLQYLNSASNPFIYAIFHRNFKLAFKETVKKVVCIKGKSEDIDLEMVRDVRLADDRQPIATTSNV